MDIKTQDILERLVRARKSAGLTQADVRKLVGDRHNLSQSNFSWIENGNGRLPMSLFLCLCEIYDISPTWALSGVNPNFDESSLRAMIEQSNVIEKEVKKLKELLENSV